MTTKKTAATVPPRCALPIVVDSIGGHTDEPTAWIITGAGDYLAEAVESDSDGRFIRDPRERRACLDYVAHAANTLPELLESVKELAGLLAHAAPSFKYQRAGREFYPNREAVDGALSRAAAAIVNAEQGGR